MPYYAHALIEHGPTKYQRGDILPDDLPGLSELVEHESAGVQAPTESVEIDSQNRVISTVHPDGIVIPNRHVKRFDGDFTGDQIDDPSTDTPLLGINHPVEPGHDAYDAGEAGA